MLNICIYKIYEIDSMNCEIYFGYSSMLLLIDLLQS